MEFPVEVLALDRVTTGQQAEQAANADCDAILLYPAGGGAAPSRCAAAAAAAAPTLMFLRHKSGPYYLWHEIVHWRFLRRNGDTVEEPNLDARDIVVDDYGEVLWRLRALYGLKNAKNTKNIISLGSNRRGH